MKRLRLHLSLVLTLLVLFPAVVLAQYSSSNYKTEETFFGIGGELDSQSANYKGQSSVGSLGVGTYSSANYQTYSGFLTPNEPFLELGIDTSTVDLGTLDTASTKTGVANFHVRAYIDSGYVVKTMSQPPTYTSGAASHTLTNMAALGTSTIGEEQFGINLVANTSPATFGANPSPQPDSTFAFGQAASGYSTTNQYKYNVSDNIACSGTSGSCGTSSGWGATNYTISYIANISIVTAGGNYTMVHDLVAVATF